MKIKSGNNRPPSGPSYEAMSYRDRVKAFCAGREDLPIIVKGTQAWDEWMEYFEHTGNPHSGPHSYAKKVGRMTVPSELPEMFDPVWRSRDPVPLMNGTHPPKPTVEPTTGIPSDQWEAERQRENIARMIAELKLKLGPSKFAGGARDRRDAEAEKRAAQEWLANYSSSEPKKVEISPRLAGLLEDMSPKRFDDAAE